MSLVKDWNQAGAAMPPRGAQRPSVRDILNPLHGLTLAELKAIPFDERSDGQHARVASTGIRYKFSAAATATGDDQLVVAPTDAAGGRWIAEPGQVVDLEFAIGFATADAATLYTAPVNSALLVHRGYWEVTADWTGGASSAIGLSSDQTPHNTKGDLHGGAGGDVAATLVASGGAAGDYIEGTVGADVAAGIILRGGKLVKFDRITSAFTAGAGKAHLVATILANPGI